MEKEKIKLIYGLGNENEEFKKTRHNIGKEIINFYLPRRINLNYSYFYQIEDFTLASNLGYMNESGKGLKELMIKLKLKSNNILVIHDEADLLFPYFKFSFGINSAGHKGVESIINNLRTLEFWRMRIGIQSKNRIKASNLVLEKWTKKELIIVEKIKEGFKMILTKLKRYLPNELNLPKNYFLNEGNN